MIVLDKIEPRINSGSDEVVVLRYTIFTDNMNHLNVICSNTSNMWGSFETATMMYFDNGGKKHVLYRAQIENSEVRYFVPILNMLYSNFQEIEENLCLSEFFMDYIEKSTSAKSTRTTVRIKSSQTKIPLITIDEFLG